MAKVFDEDNVGHSLIPRDASAKPPRRKPTLHMYKMRIKPFIEEWCDISDPHALTPTAALYEAYCQWAASKNTAPLSNVQFGMVLCQARYGRPPFEVFRMRVNGRLVRHYYGIALSY